MSNNNQSNNGQQFWLALLLLVLCLGGIIVLAIMVMKNAGGSDPDTLEAAKSIFNAVLPLLGAWIGAIIAYYFGTKQAMANQAKLMEANELLQAQAKQSLEMANTAMQLLDAARSAKAGK